MNCVPWSVVPELGGFAGRGLLGRGDAVSGVRSRFLGLELTLGQKWGFGEAICVWNRALSIRRKHPAIRRGAIVLKMKLSTSTRDWIYAVATAAQGAAWKKGRQETVDPSSVEDVASHDEGGALSPAFSYVLVLMYAGNSPGSLRGQIFIL